MRRVRGVLFLDYVRMLRRHKSPGVALVLKPEDLTFLSERIDPEAWYPMASFERFGLAILQEIVRDDHDAIRMWGYAQVGGVLEFLPGLRDGGGPRDAVKALQRMLTGLFAFPALSVEKISDVGATIRIDYGMSPAAERAASLQTRGFFEALVEECGGADVVGTFVSAAWEGAGEPTLLELAWRRRPAAAGAKGRPGGRAPRVLVVEDDALVLASLQLFLRRWADVTCVTSAREALTALEAIGFDAVLSDFDLGPGATGLELLGDVARRWPATGRVLHSAALPAIALDAVAAGTLHAAMSKPAAPSELRRAIEEAKRVAAPKKPAAHTAHPPGTRVLLHRMRYERSPTDEEYAAGLAESGRLLAQGTPHVVLVESAPDATLTRGQREAQTAWFHEHELALRRSCLGMAFVFPELLPRIALSALIATRPFPAPASVFASPAEARAWLERLISPLPLDAPQAPR